MPNSPPLPPTYRRPLPQKPAPLSQPTSVRLASLRPDRRGGGHGPVDLNRQCQGSGHGGQVGRGARLRSGARSRGDQELGRRADVPRDG